MRKWILIAVLFLLPCSVWGADADLHDSPWEKFSVRAGYFLSALDTTARLGAGIGMDIDLEDALGLDTSTSVFRFGAMWRFSDNRRHRLDMNWFSLNRESSKRINHDITIENYRGEPTVFELGVAVESFFNLDIYQLAYSYSFFNDDRLDLAASFGAYVMPIRLELSSSIGNTEKQGSADITAPLPVMGLRMDVALTPRWFIRSGFKVFYLEYDTFTGSILQIDTALEYNPWKHVGIGLGLDTFGLKVKADEEVWPGIDLNGKIAFSYTGLKLYLRCFF